MLDERGRIDTTVGADGQSRGRGGKSRDCTGAESLPHVAAAAHAGR